MINENNNEKIDTNENLKNNNSIIEYEKINLFPDVVFYHIEKCAGTSLEQCLHDYFLNKYSENEIYIPNKNNFKHVHITQKEFFEKNNFKVILGHMSFDKKEFIVKNHLSITCVRNPIDRMISHYYYFDYDKYKIPLNAFNLRELKIYVDSRKVILSRISGDTKNLDTALKNLKEINAILIFEKINEDINKLNVLLNHYFNVNKKLILRKLNEKKHFYTEEIEKDKETLYNSGFLNDELKIYDCIFNMNDEERFNI